MSLVNNSANNFKDFLDAIKPYLNYQFYDMSGQGVEANNFSADEKVIGTWIDGKPLYQKTVNCGALPINTNKIIAHNISNIGNVIFASGFAFNSSANVSLCIGYTATSSDRKADIGILVNETSIEIRTYRESVSNYTESYVTLRYTKTTDTAVASGEKIVGQWIDGKPVYEKTITSTIPMCSQQYVPESSYESIGVSVDKCIEINGFFELNGICTPISYAMAQGDTKVSCITARVLTNTASEHKNTIQLSNANTGWGGHSAIITLRYTKTTD